MSTLNHFDEQQESFRLRMLQMNFEIAERKGLAIQSALAEHSVTAFVKNLPIESPLYPAIEWLKQSEQSEIDKTEDLVQEIPHQYHEYIQWCMPAGDHERPKNNGCGFIRSMDNIGLVYSACPNEKEHYIKGKRMHCWSLRCRECMNDTALRKGVEIERKLLEYQGLCRKQGEHVGDIGHWVVSPPQEFAKSMIQTRYEFDILCKHVDDNIMANGALAGVTIFHPWRQKETMWELSPHFHLLCYGKINTKQFKKDNPRWIIKKVHPKEKIRSIRHTAAYLMTHMGIGESEKDPDHVEWDLKIMNHLMPGLISPDAGYSEKDHNDKSKDKGRMVGDISDIDWEQWTIALLSKDLRMRYWGGLSRNKIRKLDTFREYKIRVCKECGEILRTYDGFDDHIGKQVTYIQITKLLHSQNTSNK